MSSTILLGIFAVLASAVGGYFTVLAARANKPRVASLSPLNGATDVLLAALVRMKKLESEKAALAAQLAECEHRHEQRTASRRRRPASD